MEQLNLSVDGLLVNCFHLPHLKPGREGAHRFKQSEGSRIECQVLNPFIAPACKLSGLKRAHTHIPANSIFSDPITSDFNSVCLDENHFTYYCERLKDFKFFTFIGCFSNDITAVKRLRLVTELQSDAAGQPRAIRWWEWKMGWGGIAHEHRKALIYGSGKPHSVAVSFPLGEVWWVGKLFKCEEAHTHTSNRHAHTHTHKKGKGTLKYTMHVYKKQKWPQTRWSGGHLFKLHIYAAWKSKCRSFHAFVFLFKLVICCYMESFLCTPVNIYS